MSIILNKKECDDMFCLHHDFELFKSEACHRLKNIGDLEFINEIINEDIIISLWEDKEYQFALYLLAMIDYLCKINNIALCKNYDELRKQKMANIIYPKDVLYMDLLNPSDNIKNKILLECKNNECSKEFLKYNIIEGDIRDVK